MLRTTPGFSLDSILQRSESSAKANVPSAAITHDFNDILKDRDIDMVVVNTPDHTHYAYARACIEAGKHVVVEKPFVQKIHEGEELMELARKKGTILTVFQNRRWEGDFLTARQIIKSGVLGRLVEFEAHLDRFRNFIRDSWKEKPENNTGTLYNLGTHLVDQALLLFGTPDAVNADLRKQRTGARVDDLFDLNLMYPDLKVTLKGSYLVREPGPRFLLHGTEGSWVKYGADPQEDALTNGHLPDEPGFGKEAEEHWGILNTNVNGLHVRCKVETLPGCYHEFYRSLYRTIVNGDELAVKPEEALEVIRIIDAAYESNGKRCAILTK
jgi:predicted dehydrogenase